MEVEADGVGGFEDVFDEVVAHDVADQRDARHPTSRHEFELGHQRLFESLWHPNRQEVVVFA